jgi:hypothetical protein
VFTVVRVRSEKVVELDPPLGQPVMEVELSHGELVEVGEKKTLGKATITGHGTRISHPAATIGMELNRQGARNARTSQLIAIQRKEAEAQSRENISGIGWANRRSTCRPPWRRASGRLDNRRCAAMVRWVKNEMFFAMSLAFFAVK